MVHTTTPPLPFPPKDCKACSGAQHMLDTYKHMALQGKQKEQEQQEHTADTQQHSTESTGRGGTHSQQQHTVIEDDAGAGSTSSAYGPYGRQCPPDTQELGRATWTFLHTMAAYYPEEPSRTQQTLMRNVMEGVAEFYPCSFCRAHLQDQVRAEFGLCALSTAHSN